MTMKHNEFAGQTPRSRQRIVESALQVSAIVLAVEIRLHDWSRMEG